MQETQTGPQHTTASRLTTVIVVVGGLLALALAFGTLGASAEPNTIDDDTRLDESATIDSFEANGTVRADAPTLNLTITVSRDRREAGVDAVTGGMHTYIRVQYNESVDRTVRIYIPDAYMEPRVKSDVQSLTDGTTAEYEPVEQKDATAVVVELDGQTDATFEVNRAFGTYLSATDRAYGVFESVTGFRPPRVGARERPQWQFPPPGALSGGNATYQIQDAETADNMTIQYDATPNSEESSWIRVPKCSASVEPVCVADREGGPVLFATNNSVPPIRYKYSADRVEDAKSGGKKLKDAWGDLIDGITGIFGTVAPVAAAATAAMTPATAGVGG